uniref:TIR domain-containing protein n=1 Tax=Candidatus Kentrum sp. FM TaxID=2126340 RepID=A0A450SDX9_9GAMM|nr:MAG: TIR domain-containing protein [Candidatus Kentron sp. FM]VFJ50825.1 MAG: TIR domain-containing protein [Candidatus Kentron sp. FM]VFK10350.1 MAG: TIR domain-containing protein [Candidatus Kentron sp. FM]
MGNLFISHRKADADSARRLANELQAAGHRVWFDEWEIAIGDSIVEHIDQGLGGMSYLVLCYSASGPSPWVNREWMPTLSRQLAGLPVKILPVLLTGDASAAPAILADIQCADLVTDWDRGVRKLLQAVGGNPTMAAPKDIEPTGSPDTGKKRFFADVKQHRYTLPDEYRFHREDLHER